MLLQGVRLSGVMTCLLLFCAVFIIVRYGIALERPGGGQVQPGLLLFVAPGVMAALTARQAPLGVALCGALLAIPVCLMVSYSQLVAGAGFWQELAWYASALFWCVSGALVVMLWRALFQRHQR